MELRRYGGSATTSLRAGIAFRDRVAVGIRRRAARRRRLAFSTGPDHVVILLPQAQVFDCRFVTQGKEGPPWQQRRGAMFHPSLLPRGITTRMAAPSRARST